MSKLTKTKSILYVEDEKNVQEELAEVLTVFCENLYVADNGAQGLELFEKHLPEIVITDISMPVMNGLEATTAIKEFRSELPIIAQTAYAMEADREKTFKAGCDDYISKPIRRKILIELLDKYIHKK